MSKLHSWICYNSLASWFTILRRWICFKSILMLKSYLFNLKAAKVLFISLAIIVTVQQLCSINSEQSSIRTEDIVKKIRGLWTYKCINHKCRRTLYKAEEKDSHQTPLNVCKLRCGDPPGSLWPLPNGHVSIDEQTVAINPNNIKIESAPADKEIDSAAGKLYLELRKSFVARLVTETGRDTRPEGHGLLLKLQIEDTTVEKPSLDMDESYHLQVETVNNQIKASITARTYFGARHGTETLNQLIVHDDVTKSLLMPNKLEIRDRPVYRYRSLSLDTSRNFIPIEAIKRTIDGMASVKMNILHWHIADTHSFPLESKTFPYLTIYGAYGPDKLYKQKDVKDLVEFAKWKGVKIIPEFDAPAHTGEGWQWTDDALITFNAQPWYKYCVEPPCGQLNPISENVYKILQGIQTDMHNLFDISEVFHMGGDEVELANWNNSKEIQEYMITRGWDINDSNSLIRLWNEFQKRAYSSLQHVTAKSPLAILWTNTLTEREDVTEILDRNHYILQVWTNGYDEQIKKLAKKGYRLIFSNHDALYLDCGFGGWVTDGNNWCSPYKTWQKIYSNDLVQNVKNVTKNEYKTEMAQLIYGASATIWTEEIDEHSLDGRVWPRLAALAERLWTNPSTPWQDAEFRFLHQRERLVKMGIHPEALQPQWCRQNEGDCPDTRTIKPPK